MLEIQLSKIVIVLVPEVSLKVESLFELLVRDQSITSCRSESENDDMFCFSETELVVLRTIIDKYIILKIRKC